MKQDSITGSMLYNLVECPHRVHLDLHGDITMLGPVNAFVQLLWDRGNAFEKEVMASLHEPFTDLSIYSDEEKEAKTLEAMQRGDGLIYSGRIRAGGLLGVPDLLRRTGGGYAAGDIKSGRGVEFEGDEENGKPKKHYGVQLALYTDILENLGLSAGRLPFIWDVHGAEYVYDLNAPLGPRSPSLWELYQENLITARQIVACNAHTLAAMASKCKLCQWYAVCMQDVIGRNDLTLIPELGRAKRDVMYRKIPSVRALAEADVGDFLRHGDKTVFHGIGLKSLEKFQQRARLLSAEDARPMITAPFTLPEAEVELFFDIETDPMRDICYLHGFTERVCGHSDNETYFAFTAEQPTAAKEKRAFEDAWRFLRSRPGAAVYYYSQYEKTYYKKLAAAYPDVVSVDEVEAFFASPLVVDLYSDIVKKCTEWPTYNHSIKTLARYLGFAWRDSDPSGASSIEWYHQWVETGDDAIRKRILDYNEDDCKATRVVVDGVRGMVENKPSE